MSRIDHDRAALTERIKVAAAALEIPADAVADVLRHGTSYHRTKAVKVLVAFAGAHGVSLDYLISGDLGAMFRAASTLLKSRQPKAA